MLFRDAFKTSTRSLTHGKMRSILTMLGIVIGIASVIILMSIGQSAQDIFFTQDVDLRKEGGESRVAVSSDFIYVAYRGHEGLTPGIDDLANLKPIRKDRETPYDRGTVATPFGWQTDFGV